MGRNRKSIRSIAESVSPVTIDRAFNSGTIKNEMDSLANEIRNKSFDENDSLVEQDTGYRSPSSNSIFQSFIDDVYSALRADNTWDVKALEQLTNTTSEDYGNDFAYPRFSSQSAGAAIDDAISQIRSILSQATYQPIEFISSLNNIVRDYSQMADNFDNDDSTQERDTGYRTSSSRTIYQDFIDQVRAARQADGTWNMNALARIAQNRGADYGDDYDGGKRGFRNTSAANAIDDAIEQIRNTIKAAQKR